MDGKTVSPPVTATDFTTPAAIVSASVVAVALIAALVWGPTGISEKVMPILTAIIAVIVPAFGAILIHKQDATHLLVNSNMMAFRAEAETARELALKFASEQLAAAIKQSRAEGLAEGLASGRAEAVTALSAAVTLTPAVEDKPHGQPAA